MAVQKKSSFHDFYLTEIPPDEGSGYIVHQVNSEGNIIRESYIPFEDLEWFQKDKDFVMVSERELREILSGEE